MEMILDYLLGLAQATPVGLLALGVLGTLVVLATLAVQLTPSKSDDALLAKILAHKVWGPIWKKIESLSLIKKTK